MVQRYTKELSQRAFMVNKKRPFRIVVQYYSSVESLKTHKQNSKWVICKNTQIRSLTQLAVLLLVSQLLVGRIDKMDLF